MEHLLAGYGHAGTVYEEASTGALGINGDARVPKESAVVHLRSIVSTRNPNLHRGGVRPARLTPRLLHCIILRSMVSHIMQHEIELRSGFSGRSDAGAPWWTVRSLAGIVARKRSAAPFRLVHS